MTDWDKELRKRRAALDRAEQGIEEAATGAHADGHPYRWIGERVRMNHETVRKVVARVNADRANACNAPNYDDRCELPAGHEGRHRDGNWTWPEGVERPVNPARRPSTLSETPGVTHPASTPEWTASKMTPSPPEES